MKSATLIRTSSMPVQKLIRATKSSISCTSADIKYRAKSGSSGNLKSAVSLHKDHDLSPKSGSIRRSESDSNFTRSENKVTRMLSRASEARLVPDAFAATRIVEEKEETEDVYSWLPMPSMMELENILGGDGNEGGSYSGEGNGGGGDLGDDKGKSKIGEYYEEMLKTNPGDALLLQNYAKYLYEVEHNPRKAEEYCGRAILASNGSGEGELLSLYGTLIWETERDGERAESYFDQAVHASPNDCMVMGSYAHFLWDSEEEEEAEVISKDSDAIAAARTALIGTFS